MAGATGGPTSSERAIPSATVRRSRLDQRSSARCCTQAAALLRLLDAVHGDQRVRAFSLGGSMARGRADELSDLDTRVWVADDVFDSMLADLPSLARAVGMPLDILFETPGSPFLFVQYVDGVQLELLAVRASEVSEGVTGHVVLLDRDGLLDDAPEPPPPWGVDLWVGWAWMRLFDLDKYLRRGEIWRAFIQLQEIRNLLLRHHAATTEIPEPELGLTSILNFNGSLPARLEETVAELDAADLRRAASVCAQLLAGYERRPFGDFVQARLASRG
jgi:predicted nucleotidyltransferase